MSHNSTYNLTVRGANVRISFKRINDSRRLPVLFEARKQPNLFGVKGATLCDITAPRLLGDYDGPRGIAFCYLPDDWRSQKGRHESLKDALRSTTLDKFQRRDTWVAFRLEEDRRMKIKGPAGEPGAHRRKLKHPRTDAILNALVDLRKIAAEINAGLARITYPLVRAERSKALQEEIRQAEIPMPPPSPSWPQPIPGDKFTVTYDPASPEGGNTVTTNPEDYPF